VTRRHRVVTWNGIRQPRAAISRGASPRPSWPPWATQPAMAAAPRRRSRRAYHRWVPRSRRPAPSSPPLSPGMATARAAAPSSAPAAGSALPLPREMRPPHARPSRPFVWVPLTERSVQQGNRLVAHVSAGQRHGSGGSRGVGRRCHTRRDGGLRRAQPTADRHGRIFFRGSEGNAPGRSHLWESFGEDAKRVPGSCDEPPCRDCLCARQSWSLAGAADLHRRG